MLERIKFSFLRVHDKLAADGVDSQHSIAAPLELVVHRLNRTSTTLFLDPSANRLDMGRWLAAVVEQRKDPHFLGNTAHFQDGPKVKV